MQTGVAHRRQECAATAAPPLPQQRRCSALLRRQQRGSVSICSGGATGSGAVIRRGGLRSTDNERSSVSAAYHQHQRQETELSQSSRIGPPAAWPLCSEFCQAALRPIAVRRGGLNGRRPAIQKHLRRSWPSAREAGEKARAALASPLSSLGARKTPLAQAAQRPFVLPSPVPASLRFCSQHCESLLQTSLPRTARSFHPPRPRHCHSLAARSPNTTSVVPSPARGIAGAAHAISAPGALPHR